jgi:hypothetical protein
MLELLDIEDPSKLSFSRPFFGVAHVLDDEPPFSFRGLRSVAATTGGVGVVLRPAPTRRGRCLFALARLVTHQDQRVVQV